MARSSKRVGLFSSNRGRAAKKFLIIGGVALLVLFFGNGLLSDSPQDADDAREARIESALGDDEDDEPAVAAPVSRPFATPIEGGVQDVESGDIYGDALDRPEEEDQDASPDEGEEEEQEESATEQLQRSDSYRSAVRATTKFAEAYGTHSYEQDAKEWVDSLPGMSSKAKATLLESAKKQWPEMVDRKASSTATPLSEGVTPIYSRDGGKTIQLSVSVAKETSYEGEKGYSSDAYAVTLERAEGASDGWVVVGVS